MDGQTKVIAQVIQERKMQDRQWGGPPHDDTHFPTDWLRWIDHQIELGCGEDNNEDGSHNWRLRYIKIAALAIAAVEAIDRQ